MMRSIGLLALLLLVPPVAAEECLDKTGIRWAAPFEKALERAHAQKRLLMIKPVAFGTSPDGGW